MARTISGGVEANLLDVTIFPFYAVEMQFDGGNILRLWTGFGDLVYDDDDDPDTASVTYFGTGNLLDISSVEETVEMAARGATLTLSAVPTEVISLALSQPYQGRICKIFFGLFQKGNLEQQSSTEEAKAYLLMQNGDIITLNKASTSLTEVFIGYMDQMSIEEGADVSTIEVKIENKLIDLERPRVGRFTSQYQKSLFPNDKGFDFVESMQDVPLTWGRKSA